ncbi:MAG TPA: hypothetical protein PLD62_05170 [Candidatus Cloacimonadota bacterium]|nr:hypothetical protein [Candidatus Cloacimonadota bacterium]
MVSFEKTPKIGEIEDDIEPLRWLERIDKWRRNHGRSRKNNE